MPPSSAVGSTRPAFPTRRASDLFGRVFSTGLEELAERFQLPLFRIGLAGEEIEEDHMRPRGRLADGGGKVDRKSTRLNSSHLGISYAVFCLKKKKINIIATD